MPGLEDLLKEAVQRVNEHAQAPELEEIDPDTNVFDAVDSMSIVDLLLETEALLAEGSGEYRALASEIIFDASASPLRRWSDWVAYVERRDPR
ncbi:MAG TPA: hypothetical protein VK614_04910 [Allosphingosinicella sp.]|nr:hypothetical protein [Allosphingosinicella sp.]